ncbi:MAG: hypothetical protein ABIT16_05305 [Croceibacterium sp.]
MKLAIRSREAWLFAAALAFSYLVLHARSLGFGYFDDDYYQDSQTWQTVVEAIKSDPQFRPIFWLLFPLTSSALGNTPFAHHLVNHALHLANCVLAFFVLRPRIGERRAGIAVLAWNMLPQLAFSLGWIAERNDPLFTIFLLSSILLHDQGHKWLAWPMAVGSFLSKVTAVAFPLAFATKYGLRRYPGDRAAGLTLFATFAIVSFAAAHDDGLQSHLQGLGWAMLALNAVKNFILAIVTWWVPIPFLGGPLEIAGWVLCLAATGWLLIVHGKRDAQIVSLALIALLLALPCAKTPQLRITYTMSLFIVAAVVGAIRPGVADLRFKGAAWAALLGLACYAIPATTKTLNAFDSNVRDVSEVDPSQDANDAYPVPFYPWFRAQQERLLGQ